MVPFINFPYTLFKTAYFWKKKPTKNTQNIHERDLQMNISDFSWNVGVGSFDLLRVTVQCQIFWTVKTNWPWKVTVSRSNEFWSSLPPNYVKYAKLYAKYVKYAKYMEYAKLSTNGTGLLQSEIFFEFSFISSNTCRVMFLCLIEIFLKLYHCSLLSQLLRIWNRSRLCVCQCIYLSMLGGHHILSLMYCLETWRHVSAKPKKCSHIKSYNSWISILLYTLYHSTQPTPKSKTRQKKREKGKK